MKALGQIDLRIKYNHKCTKKFNPETRWISRLYWSKLKGYNTKSISKINIIVSDDWDENEKKQPLEVVGCKEVLLDFNFKKYFEIEKVNRKKMLLDIINEGMIQIAKKEGWEIDPLLDAYNQCLKDNLEYKYFVGEPKTSKNKKYRVSFWCNWDIDTFQVFWVLFDSSGNEIKRQKFIEKPPYEGEFMYFAKWKWIDNETVLLEDKYKYGKNETWQIKIFS